MFLINGQFNEILSIQDRGLHYGDGVFETIAIQDERPLCWDKHISRLNLGCRCLGFDCPAEELLQYEANQLCANTQRGVLKIILTRGQGGRGYKPPESRGMPTRILANYPWPDFPEANAIHGVKIKICNTRLGRNSQLAGIKHLNRLEQVLARSEWDTEDIAEGLMLDTEGNVIEGTMSNLFIAHGDKLLTPDLTYCGIAGIIRQSILALAPEFGMQIGVMPITQNELYAADEIFLCNSVIGIWPVCQLVDHYYEPGLWAARIRGQLIKQGVIAA